MKRLRAFLCLALSVLQLSVAQNDVRNCSDISSGLETEPIDPATVPDLPVCMDQRNNAQCCSSSYITDRLGITEEDFLAGLRAELEDRFDDFDDLVERLRAYLEGQFVSSYFGSFGDFNFLNNGSAIIDEFMSTFRDNLEFDPEDDDDGDEEEEDSDSDGEEDTDVNGFNVERFLRSVVSRFEDAAAEQFGGGSVEKAQCIRDVIENNIEQQRMEAQARALQQVRRVLASIERLQAFLQNFTNDLAGFRPLRQCIETVVRLNTCGRCTAVRPLFCRNVCGAIASACYSPFNDAMENQLEELWEVVRRILDAATDALGDLNRNRGIFGIDQLTLVRQVVTNCRVDTGAGSIFSKRQSDDDSEDDSDDEGTGRIPLLPLVVRTAARALSGGPFDYEGRRSRGSGLCRRIRTASSNCWDGQEERDDDIEEFDGDDIEDQVNNPVIDLDNDELREQATSLGTPVSAALSDPSFAQVAPSGLVLPGQETNNNGATKAFLSLSSFTMMLIAGAVYMMW